MCTPSLAIHLNLAFFISGHVESLGNHNAPIDSRFGTGNCPSVLKLERLLSKHLNSAPMSDNPVPGQVVLILVGLIGSGKVSSPAVMGCTLTEN
jgi:hypothetical protein